jgi:cytochrome c-type biogenesis protein CcmE
MTKERKLAFGALALFFGLSVVILFHSISPYKTPSDLASFRGEIQNIQVAGKIEDVERTANFTEFYLSDDKARIKVIYNGSIDAQNQEIVVVGNWKNGTLHAYKILRKCHTEYTG